jgi:hypothetical protein
VGRVLAGLPAAIVKVVSFPLLHFTALLTRTIDAFGHVPETAMEPASSYMSETEVMLALTACVVAHLVFWYAFWAIILRLSRRQRAIERSGTSLTK